MQSVTLTTTLTGKVIRATIPVHNNAQMMFVVLDACNALGVLYNTSMCLRMAERSIKPYIPPRKRYSAEVFGTDLVLVTAPASCSFCASNIQGVVTVYVRLGPSGRPVPVQVCANTFVNHVLRFYAYACSIKFSNDWSVETADRTLLRCGDRFGGVGDGDALTIMSPADLDRILREAASDATSESDNVPDSASDDGESRDVRDVRDFGGDGTDEAVTVFVRDGSDGPLVEFRASAGYSLMDIPFMLDMVRPTNCHFWTVVDGARTRIDDREDISSFNGATIEVTRLCARGGVRV